METFHLTSTLISKALGRFSAAKIPNSEAWSWQPFFNSTSSWPQIARVGKGLFRKIEINSCFFFELQHEGWILQKNRRTTVRSWFVCLCYGIPGYLHSLRQITLGHNKTGWILEVLKGWLVMIMYISSFHSHLTLLLHVYEKLVDCLVLLEGPLDDHNTVRSETCENFLSSQASGRFPCSKW